MSGKNSYKYKIIKEIKEEIKSKQIDITPYIQSPDERHTESQVVKDFLKEIEDSINYSKVMTLDRNYRYNTLILILNFYNDLEASIFGAYTILRNIGYINKLFHNETHPQNEAFRLLNQTINRFKQYNKLEYIKDKYVSVYKWYLEILSSEYMENMLVDIYIYNRKHNTLNNKHKRRLLELIKITNNWRLMDRILLKELGGDE